MNYDLRLECPLFPTNPLLRPPEVQCQDKSCREQSQKQEQKTKIENTGFNEVRQFAYVLGVEGRRFYSIPNGYNLIQLITKHPIFIARETKPIPRTWVKMESEFNLKQILKSGRIHHFWPRAFESSGEAFKKWPPEGNLCQSFRKLCQAFESWPPKSWPVSVKVLNIGYRDRIG